MNSSPINFFYLACDYCQSSETAEHFRINYPAVDSDQQTLSYRVCIHTGKLIKLRAGSGAGILIRSVQNISM